MPPGSGPKIFREMFFGKQRRKPAGPVPIVHRPSADCGRSPTG